MCNFEQVQSTNYSAVFVNELKEVPKKITPLGIYSYTNDIIMELCKYDYIFQDSVAYSIYKFVQRKPKNNYCLSIMKTIIDQQKAFIEMTVKEE